MLTIILIVIAVLLLGFLVFVASKSSDFRVERSLAIAAQPDNVFPHIDNLRKAAVWSPWLKLDPNVRTNYDGPTGGVGSSSTWEGDKRIGAGRQVITESRPHDLVRIRLEFKKPFESTCTSEFLLKPDGRGTKVTWAIFGKNTFISKLFCTFMNQDKMIGGQFDKGLAELRTLVEKKA
jgi:hypothetical protein